MPTLYELQGELKTDYTEEIKLTAGTPVIVIGYFNGLRISCKYKGGWYKLRSRLKFSNLKNMVFVGKEFSQEQYTKETTSTQEHWLTEENKIKLETQLIETKEDYAGIII